MSLLTYACGPIATSSNSRRYRTCLFLGTVTSVITLLTLGHYPRANFHRYRSHLQEYIPTLSTSFSSPGQRIPCNPNEQVGFPDLETGVWTTLRPDCPGENFAKRLHATPMDERWESFPELRNTSVLFMGDSVGRQMFEFFCFLGQGEITRPAPPGWEDIHYGQSPRCLLPELGMEVAHIHTYSTINTSDPHAYNIMAKHFEGGEDWHLESRVDRFFATSLRDFVPDFVQLDSGPWDFRYWYTRDCLEGNRAEDLAVEDREEAAAIAVQTLHFLQNKFPRAKVWFQHPSIRAEGDYAIKVKVGNRVLGIKDNLKEDEYPPYYTHRRQAQYRATMKQRIKESGFDSLDYALLQEGIPFSVFFNPPDLTHPQHKAKLVMSNMILNLMARYIRYGV